MPFQVEVTVPPIPISKVLMHPASAHCEEQNKTCEVGKGCFNGNLPFEVCHNLVWRLTSGLAPRLHS